MRLYDADGGLVACWLCRQLHAAWARVDPDDEHPRVRYLCGATVRRDAMGAIFVCGAAAPQAAVHASEHVRCGRLQPLVDSEEWPPPEGAKEAA